MPGSAETLPAGFRLTTTSGHSRRMPPEGGCGEDRGAISATQSCIIQAVSNRAQISSSSVMGTITLKLLQHSVKSVLDILILTANFHGAGSAAYSRLWIMVSAPFDCVPIIFFQPGTVVLYEVPDSCPEDICEDWFQGQLYWWSSPPYMPHPSSCCPPRLIHLSSSVS